MVTLRETLGLCDRDVVAFVGAGGKTTAMFRLARELHAEGATVVVTTTAKMLIPPRAPTCASSSSASDRRSFRRSLARHAVRASCRS